MKKKSLMTIASLFLVSGLIACGTTTDNSSTPSSEDSTVSSIDTPAASSSEAGQQSSAPAEESHHYASTWESDKGNHWHSCNDADCDEMGSFGAHTFVKDTKKSVEATCTAKGLLVETCSVCGFTSEIVTPIIPHEFVKDASRSTDATCEVAGVIVEKCAHCPEEKTTNVAALGHKWAADPTDPRNCESTHTKNGVVVEKCPTCKESREVKQPMIKHEWTIAEGQTLTTVSGKTVQKWTCSCGTESYTMQVYDWDFLSPGSNAAGVEGFTPGTDQGHANGMRIAGNGSAYWNFPVVKAGLCQVAVGCNPAPTSILSTQIQQKNTIKINDVESTLIPQGAYNTLGLTTGAFDELLLTEFTATTDMVGSEAKIEITQKASSRLYWGGVVRVTFLPIA